MPMDVRHYFDTEGVLRWRHTGQRVAMDEIGQPIPIQQYNEWLNRETNRQVMAMQQHYPAVTASALPYQAVATMAWLPQDPVARPRTLVEPNRVAGGVNYQLADVTYTMLKREQEDTRVQAQRRAQDLLERTLGPKRWKSYRQQGFIEVMAKSGRVYKVTNTGMVSDEPAPFSGEPRRSYCIMSAGHYNGQYGLPGAVENLPLEDQILAKVLLIEADEEKFLRTAIPSPRFFGEFSVNPNRFADPYGRAIPEVGAANARQATLVTGRQPRRWYRDGWTWVTGAVSLICAAEVGLLGALILHGLGIIH